MISDFRAFLTIFGILLFIRAFCIFLSCTQLRASIGFAFLCPHYYVHIYFFLTIPHALHPNNWLNKLHFFASWAKTLKQLFHRIWKLPEMWIYCSWWKIRHCSHHRPKVTKKCKKLTRRIKNRKLKKKKKDIFYIIFDNFWDHYNRTCHVVMSG